MGKTLDSSTDGLFEESALPLFSEAPLVSEDNSDTALLPGWAPGREVSLDSTSDSSARLTVTRLPVSSESEVEFFPAPPAAWAAPPSSASPFGGAASGPSSSPALPQPILQSQRLAGDLNFPAWFFKFVQLFVHSQPPFSLPHVLACWQRILENL